VNSKKSFLSNTAKQFGQNKKNSSTWHTYVQNSTATAFLEEFTETLYSVHIMPHDVHFLREITAVPSIVVGQFCHLASLNEASHKRYY